MSLPTSSSTSSQNSLFKRKTSHCLKSFHSCKIKFLQAWTCKFCLTYLAFHNQALICNSSHISFHLPCSPAPPAYLAARAKQVAIAVWSKVCRLKSQGLCNVLSPYHQALQILPGVLVLCSVWSSVVPRGLSSLSPPAFQNFHSTSTNSIVWTAICSTFFDSPTRLQTPCKQKSWALFLHFLSTV